MTQPIIPGTTQTIPVPKAPPLPEPTTLFVSDPGDIPVPARIASPPGLGAIRTGAAATIATALIAALEISNPALAIAAIAAGTGALSWIGKTAREYLNDPNADTARLAPVKGFLASMFSWLG